MLVAECLLDRMERPVLGSESFDRDDRGAVRLHSKHEARSSRNAIDNNGTCAAHAVLTAEMRACKPEILSKKITEVLPNGGVAAIANAVDGQDDFSSG